MNKNLTVGNPLKVLVLYSLPLFGSIIFQQLYNIADSFVAGHFISTQALAAVGNSYEITLLYIAVAFGCNIGTSVVVARYFGLKDYRKVRLSASTSLIASSIIGIMLVALGIGLTVPLLELIKTPAEILSDSELYLYIYLGGYIFLLIYNISTGIFAALGDSVTPFIFLVISSLSNIGMDILFVVVFKMGVAGVAWATFICQGLSGIAALAVVLNRLKKLDSSIRKEEKHHAFDFNILKELVVISIPSVLQQGFISVGNLIIQSFINSFGTTAIGGYSAAVKLNNLALTSMTAIGNGISNFSAQNAGAGKTDRIKKGFGGGIIIALSMSAVFTLLFLTCGKYFTEWFISDGNTDAVAVSVKFLTIISPFYLFVSAKIIADGVLRGVNRMVFFMIATFADLLIRVALAAALSPAFGIDGIWYSWPIGWIIGTALSIAFYFIVRKRNFAKKLDKNVFKTLMSEEYTDASETLISEEYTDASETVISD